MKKKQAQENLKKRTEHSSVARKFRFESCSAQSFPGSCVADTSPALLAQAGCSSSSEALALQRFIAHSTTATIEACVTRAFECFLCLLLRTRTLATWAANPRGQALHGRFGYSFSNKTVSRKEPRARTRMPEKQSRRGSEREMGAVVLQFFGRLSQVLVFFRG